LIPMELDGEWFWRTSGWWDLNVRREPVELELG